MDKIDYDRIRKHLNFVPNNTLNISILFFNIILFFLAVFFFLHNSFLSYCISQIFFALHFNHAYLLVHETSHYSFFSNRRMNVIVGHLASIFAFLPFFSRQFEHSGHHRWTGSFQEPSTKRALRTFCILNNHVKKLLNFCWRFWIPIFAINEHIQLWKLSFKKCFKKDAFQKRRLFSAIFLLIIYASILCLPNAFGIVVEMIPALLIYMFLIEFINLPHHVDSLIEDSSKPFAFWQQERYSKSFKPLPLGLNRILLLNFNYHVGHHFYPNLPWHELDLLQKELVKLDSKFGDLEDELTWNLKNRKQSVEIVFKKYFEFQGNLNLKSV